MEIERRTDVMKKMPPPQGRARLETVHEDAEGNVLSYDCTETPSVFQHRLGVGRPLDMPPMPFLGPVGGILITMPTVGHNKFGTDIAALTGWQMGIGTGTGAELAGDTGLSSEITTYGGAKATIIPTLLNNLITFSKQWMFTTGANFIVTESAVFKDSILMIRNLYSVTKHCVATDKLTATLTDTV